MSIINVWLERDRALVAVDTISAYLDAAGRPMQVAGVPDGSRFEVSKLVPLVHLNAVLAGRGASVLLAQAFMLANMRACSNVDQLAAAMPEILGQCFAMLRSMGAAQACEADPRQEMVLVGWSPAQHRMRGVLFHQVDARRGFEVAEVDECLVAPALPEEADPDLDPADTDRMAQLMGAQITYAEQHLAGPVGGRMVLAELTPTSLSIGQRALKG